MGSMAAIAVDWAAAIVYLGGGLLGFALVLASPLPAALFWGLGIGLQCLLAAAELADRFGIWPMAGFEGDLRFYAAGLGMLGLAAGSLFSLILPPGSKRITLVTGIVLAILMAVGSGRVPTAGLPLPLIVLGVMLVAILIGLRHRPLPARWLLVGMLMLALGELARYRYLGVLPLPAADLARLFLGLALAAFGATARSAR